MPKRLPDDLLERTIEEIQGSSASLSIDELFHRLKDSISRRSLQRRLAEWAADGTVQIEGQGRGRRYSVRRPVQPRTEAAFEPLFVRDRAKAISADNTPIPISSEGNRVRDAVSRSIIDRAPVGYQRELLDRYKPNETFYLPEILIRDLHDLGRSPRGPRPAGTYAREIFDRLLIDLSWSSSRLEGNTYSLLDTKRLIEQGTAAVGKDAKETQMILNHKAAIELLVGSTAEIGINRYTLLNLHALLADNLLDDPREAGRLRQASRAISGSTYIPTNVPQLIREQFEVLLKKGAAIRDPFEQAFFLMVHIPYLQPFVDVNKRTSRLAANIPLVKGNLVPLSFIDVPEQIYVDGLMGIYELNRVELLRDLFVWSYERSSRRYKAMRDSLPEPDTFRLKHRAALIDVIGEIVRRNLKPSRKQVTSLAKPLVQAEDLSAFSKMALDDLKELHEGNIARFRLRPSEFRRWQEK